MLLQGTGEVLCGLPGAGFDSCPSILVDSKPNGGRGGLVVRSRLWGRWVPGSRPDSTEDPPCMGTVAR
ncbi:hypothetical protein AVEN_34660-1 [Araneus ventricosus]|uniref:Uncharacterized protein n=1 Tax=Araneus ventricosus TaxID=182803 RepID=A0A4Y2B2C9_ARAVE|nr:hypothetical protein AVEN_34660-1 [Araneus ventricosus]